MIISATGEVGEVYTTEAGMEAYDFEYDQGGGKEGWMQITPVEREYVIRTFISHLCYMWVAPEEKEPEPVDFKEYPLW